MAANSQIKNAVSTASDWVSEQFERIKSISKLDKETKKRYLGYLIFFLSLIAAAILIGSMLKTNKDTGITPASRVKGFFVGLRPLWCLIKKPFKKVTPYVQPLFSWAHSVFRLIFKIFKYPALLIKAIYNYVIFVFQVLGKLCFVIFNYLHSLFYLIIRPFRLILKYLLGLFKRDHKSTVQGKSILQKIVQMPYNLAAGVIDYLVFLFKTLALIVCQLIYKPVLSVFELFKGAIVAVNKCISSSFIGMLNFFSNMNFKDIIVCVCKSPIQLLQFLGGILRNFGKGFARLGKLLFNFDRLLNWWEHVCDDEV